MTRDELIAKVKVYFNVKELVCKHVWQKFREQSWQFISTELLSTLYTLRYEVVKQPMIVNTWASSGTLSQRGLRCNMCQLVADKTSVYMSAHSLGKAIDFHVNGMAAESVRKLIKDNINKFEYPIRLEEGVSWVHIDCYTLDGNTKLVTFTE